MNIELSDEESAALLAELDRIIDADRYPLSHRVRTLKAIRASSDQSRCANLCRRRAPSQASARAAGEDQLDPLEQEMKDLGIENYGRRPRKPKPSAKP